MAYGAGVVGRAAFQAAEIVDPRRAVGSILATYDKYPTTGKVLPAMGYGAQQVAELEQTINDAAVDLVLVATPIDLRRVLKVRHPMERVRYELQPIGAPTLIDLLAAQFAAKTKNP
jgi:predicted GTPase